MSFLGDLKTYWAANSTLNSALPSTSVFVGYVPARSTFPYAVVTTIGQPSDWTTGKSYLGTMGFQVSIYHTSLASAESIAATVVNQLAFSNPVSGSWVEPGNYVVFKDPDAPQDVYHSAWDFRIRENKQLP